ncbi:hypothetical protein D3C73_1542550 [compost metagenome]
MYIIQSFQLLNQPADRAAVHGRGICQRRSTGRAVGIQPADQVERCRLQRSIKAGGSPDTDGM